LVWEKSLEWLDGIFSAVRGILVCFVMVICGDSMVSRGVLDGGFLGLWIFSFGEQFSSALGWGMSGGREAGFSTALLTKSVSSFGRNDGFGRGEETDEGCQETEK
jgi:hypothetical protein